MFGRLRNSSFVGGLTLITVGYIAQMLSRHFYRRHVKIDNELVAKLNVDPEIQKMFELEDNKDVSSEQQ